MNAGERWMSLLVVAAAELRTLKELMGAIRGV